MMAQHQNNDGSGERIITARYAGRCRVPTCRASIAPGESIAYGRLGSRCMRCVDGRDFTPAPMAPQRYGPLDASGNPIEPKKPVPGPVTVRRPRPPIRTYEQLFPEDD